MGLSFSCFLEGHLFEVVATVRLGFHLEWQGAANLAGIDFMKKNPSPSMYVRMFMLCAWVPTCK